jgi:hypothetical protein
MASLKRIHINQHKIKANKKHGTNEKVISVKHGKRNIYGHEVEIQGPSKVFYRPEKPLSCGARVWVETEATVLVDGHDVELADPEFLGSIYRLNHAFLGKILYRVSVWNPDTICAPYYESRNHLDKIKKFLLEAGCEMKGETYLFEGYPLHFMNMEEDLWGDLDGVVESALPICEAESPYGEAARCSAPGLFRVGDEGEPKRK